MRKVVLLCSIFLLIFSCAKERYLPLSTEGNKVLETVILQPQGRDFFYPIKKNTGLSTHLLLGKYENEYTARILLKFGAFPDSAIIDSAQIILFSQNLLGDSSTSFEAKMYSITSEWEENEIVNWGQPDLSLDSFNVVSYSIITPSDSDSVVFDLDPSMVNRWADTTQVDANHGVWIDCEGASFFKDFYSGEVSSGLLRPRLRMVYHKENQDDTTLTTFSFPSKDAFALISNLKLDDDLIYIGKGIAFHSFLKFNVENVVDSTATISKADLQLIINRDYSIFNAVGASDLRVMRVTSEVLEPEQVTIDSVFGGYYGSVLVDTVLVDVRGLIQNWTARNSSYPNYGFLLQSFGEDQTLSRIGFHSSQADSINAPKLIIKYTLPPSEN